MLSRVGTVKGKTNVGGLIGDSSDFGVTFDMVQSRADKVVGDENVGGLLGRAGSDAVEWLKFYNTSSFANVYAKDVTQMGGVFGESQTKSDGTTLIEWTPMITAAALFNSADNSRVYEPLITPAISGAIQGGGSSSAIKNLRWFVTGKADEKAVSGNNSTAQLINNASFKFTKDQVNTIVNSLNTLAGNSADYKWSSAEFVLGGTKTVLPLLTVKNMSLPE